MHGLYVLWWVQEKHVSVPAVAAILAAGDLALTVLEVPTGWLADRCGHRVSLIAGSLFQIAGMLFAWLAGGVAGMLASSLLIAGGDAFRSGADQALLYRSCAAVGDAAFQRIEARSRALQLAALVALILAGGAIVGAWGYDAGWATETAVSTIGLVLALAMIEPPPAPMPRDPADVPGDPTGARVGWAPSGLIVPASILAALASAFTFLVQSMETSDPSRITTLVAMAALAEAAGAFVGGRAPATRRPQLVLAAVGLSIAAAGALVPAAFAASAIALCFVMGMATPMRAAAIQHVAGDRVRARAASLASACDKALQTIAIVSAGFVPRKR